MAEEMPLIKNVNNQRQRHRRSMSVEDRLAGLTIEYSNLEDSKRRTGLNNSNAAAVPVHKQSSGDAFQQNTAVITAKDPASSSPPVPRRKYTDFSDKLPAVVEMDDEENPHSEGHEDDDSMI
ncbi:MAG: hypothetical protein SGARI_004147 [Bacillariaceae sp.]